MLPATIEWKEGRLLLLDQRQLPSRTEYVSCESAEETARAIENMTVRGAPAIGVAAAYGLVLALKGEDFAAAARRLAGTRPTAVNLFWAIRRMEALWRANEDKKKVSAASGRRYCRKRARRSPTATRGRSRRPVTARRSEYFAPPPRRARR